MANPNPELHIENLIPAKKGEIRNPNGSSKKQRLTNALIKLLDQEGEDAFIQAGYKAAKAADFNFWKYIYERVEGPIVPPEQPEDDGIMAELERRAAERTSKKPASGHTPPVSE